MRFKLFLLLIPLVYSMKLTPTENARVKHICGASRNGMNLQRSFGGRKIRPNEYPWVVAIGILGKGIGCSGALITPYHVLTAAHCLRKAQSHDVYTPEECKQKKHRNSKELVAPVRFYRITIGSICRNIRGCPTSLIRQVYKTYTPGNYNECSYENDFAIFELIQPVPEGIATPVCMPQTSTKIAKHLKSAGIGATSPNGTAQDNNGYQVVNVDLSQEKDGEIVVATKPGVGSCNGDSGGPLFQTDKKKKITVVGVLSSGDSCEPNTQDQLDYYTDVRRFVGFTCKAIGINNVDVSQNAEKRAAEDISC